MGKPTSKPRHIGGSDPPAKGDSFVFTLALRYRQDIVIGTNLRVEVFDWSVWSQASRPEITPDEACAWKKVHAWAEERLREHIPIQYFALASLFGGAQAEACGYQAGVRTESVAKRLPTIIQEFDVLHPAVRMHPLVDQLIRIQVCYNAAQERFPKTDSVRSEEEREKAVRLVSRMTCWLLDALAHADRIIDKYLEHGRSRRASINDRRSPG